MTLLIDFNNSKFAHLAQKLIRQRVFVLTNKTFKLKRIKLMKFTLMGALI